MLSHDTKALLLAYDTTIFTMQMYKQMDADSVGQCNAIWVLHPMAILMQAKLGLDQKRGSLYVVYRRV